MSSQAKRPSPLMWDNDYRLTANQKKELKLYFSFGKNDKVCPPNLAEEMLATLKRSPYSNLRVNWHEMATALIKDIARRRWFGFSISQVTRIRSNPPEN